ncbi:extensin [Streptomyces sp. DSM 40750]|uniref:extensin n=1 Tax=Streptomyces sp. DSM 40750 TaxID=2801030 RepID=UPI00214C44DF|nr:extensin [Streptomyces sp. DSM 40750]UUU28424.1 extensin [Streptomyces sp. DSM 40750]
MTPTRALTSSLPLATAPATAPSAVQRQAPQPAVPLRRPTPTTGRPSPGTGPAVQRLTADKPASRTAIPLTVAPTTPPRAPQRPSTLPARAVTQREAATAPDLTPTTPHAPTPPLPTAIQRAPETSLRPTTATTTTAVSPVTATAAPSAHRTASAASPPTGPSPNNNDEAPKAQFDPRSLTDFQLDELTHKLIGRITRLVRTELRLDRERIGKLRDPRH